MCQDDKGESNLMSPFPWHLIPETWRRGGCFEQRGRGEPVTWSQDNSCHTQSESPTEASRHEWTLSQHSQAESPTANPSPVALEPCNKDIYNKYNTVPAQLRGCGKGPSSI